MPRQSKQPRRARPGHRVEFRDPDPPKARREGVWEHRLSQVLANPGRWAMIYEAHDEEQAQNAADNLSRRLVIVPRPDDDWGFISRGREVFAIYRGRKQSARVRRAK